MVFDELLARSGSNLVPSEKAIELVTSNLLGKAMTQFIDGNFAGSSKDVGAQINFSDDNGPARQTSILSIFTILTDLGDCRTLPPGFTIEGETTSITVRGSNATIAEVILRYSQGQEEGCEKDRGLSCQFWNATTKKWSTEGCWMTSSNDTETVCTCNHLTEFALLRERDCTEGNDEELRLIVYLVLSGLYALLFIYALLVMWESHVSKRGRMMLYKCIFLTVQSATRIPLCIAFSGVFSYFSFSSLPTWALLVLFCTPHTFMWGAFFMTIYQCSVVNFQEKSNNLELNVFKKHMWMFYCTMGVVSCVIWTSGAIFLFYINDPVRIIGPISLATVAIGTAGCTLYAGSGTINVIRTVQSNSSATNSNKLNLRLRQPNKEAHGRQLCRIVAFISILSIGLVLQSIIWVIAGTLSLSMVAFLTAMVAFYVADLLMLMTQLDYVRGMKGMSCICWLGGTIFSWVSKSSVRLGGDSPTGMTSSNGKKFGVRALRRLRSKSSEGKNKRSSRSPPGVDNASSSSLLFRQSDLTGGSSRRRSLGAAGRSPKSERMRRCSGILISSTTHAIPRQPSTQPPSVIRMVTLEHTTGRQVEKKAAGTSPLRGALVMENTSSAFMDDSEPYVTGTSSTKQKLDMNLHNESFIYGYDNIPAVD
mmetsp:Transcript_18009/g.34134  ORF Transcript_18009/g.34134 Transcript_18009/m.34134 type:complete len:649 (-) Transcript_18009:285-2231(-)